jgi:hypothetical protein
VVRPPLSGLLVATTHHNVPAVCGDAQAVRPRQLAVRGPRPATCGQLSNQGPIHRREQVHNLRVTKGRGVRSRGSPILWDRQVRDNSVHKAVAVSSACTASEVRAGCQGERQCWEGPGENTGASPLNDGTNTWARRGCHQCQWTVACVRCVSCVGVHISVRVQWVSCMQGE